MNRRSFVAGTTAAVGAAALPSLASCKASTGETLAQDDKPYEFCTFIKFIQSLSHEELAETLKKIGFDLSLIHI